ncbi:hypothetical protein DFH07DRAFT_770705 [Mycena maculata]|uniref:Uncharacterized protein n=1 Tax=Mycena maculata TaxID=230809 RepID=A0AAD7NJQ9_9AGAR|nr:hypothetical protein DFH07DRAFT_770705 [Mycena maculata]
MCLPPVGQPLRPYLFKRRPQKNPKKAGSSARPGRKAAAKPSVSNTSSPTELPSAPSLLNHNQQTTDEWYKSPRTKKDYGNYVKSGKAWIIEWTSEGTLDDEISADAFDIITSETPLPLRALTAFKCEHLERGFATAEGLRSAFKDYFERVCGCQGDFWKYNSHMGNWEGNPVFESGYESLQNCHNRTSTATQALPMLPADLKMIMEYLDSTEAIKYFTVTQRLYFKAFLTTAFTLWTRNDELINLQSKDILRSATGIPYHEFALIFHKTNKDPTKDTWFRLILLIPKSTATPISMLGKNIWRDYWAVVFVEPTFTAFRRVVDRFPD